MKPHELLHELSKRGIKLWLDGDQLRIRAPKGALTSELRVAMTEQKAELLAMLQKTSEKVSTPIGAIPRGANLPLSFAQQRLWVFDQLNPGSAAYNIPANLRFTGRLDLPALERSLTEIVRRHEALRTSFALLDEQPVQMIAPEFEIVLPVTDLREVSENERETELQRLALAEFQKPFDLTQCPLFRIHLVQMAEEDHVVLMTVHHIIFDEWSAGVFLRELADLYEAFLHEKPSPLAELSVQYADFTLWQNAWLQGQVLEQQLAYWKNQYSDDLPILELPADQPRSAQQTFQGQTFAFTLSKTLSESLKSLSAQEGCTLFMTMLAAFHIFLYRYTGQDDIVVGTPVANRTRTELEQLIGFFVNTLALRINLSANPSFREVLGRVRKLTVEGYGHQDLPFDQLVEELHPERQAGQNPLFQVMFVLQNAPMRTLELPGLAIRPFQIEDSMSLFDLTLLVEEEDRKFRCEFVYNCDLFESATIQRMSRHFKRIVEAVVNNPDQRISEIPLLSESERHQLLVEWNNTQAEFSAEKCLHQLFEAQVERSPEKMAVMFREQAFSYRELEARANQLARYLRRLGVQPETLVAIMVERSLDMIVGLLAILKAGGGYLPLAHDYPEERLTVILSDAEVPILLTQQHLLPRLPATSAEIICMDTDWGQIARESAEQLKTVTSPEHIACLLYTSGSTGTPKGAILPHRALVSFTESAIALYGFTEADRILQYSSVSFDALIEEIFPCLSCGGSIVVRTDEQIWTDVPEFLKKCEGLKLTVLDLSTAYWHLITSELLLENLQVPESLRLVIIGGDRAIPEKADTWRKYVGDSVTLMNTYGPTETTVVVTAYELPAEGREADLALLPIGRPLGNVQIYILDPSLHLVPIGVAGELHVGGEQLARGYLNRPELTEEKFIPNPFTDDPNARLYKTGDLARYLPDGNIEFLGRVDLQVKVRGFRIEPGEVEAVLSAAPGVRETAVIAREDIPGEKRLVAYVVPVQEEASETLVADVRSFLQEKLPNYMIPEMFVMLDSLPRTATGKLHRRALPAPDKSRSELSQAFVAPRSPVEQSLVAIWQDVLHIERVGVYDNFFELGGNSLLVTRLMSRVRRSFQVELPIAMLFEASTIAGLAEVIEQDMSGTREIDREAKIPKRSSAEAPILSFAQQRLWFLSRFEPENPSYNMPFAVRVHGRLAVDILERSLQEIVRRHEILRTTFTERDDRPIQVISPEPAFQFAVEDLQSLAPEQQEERIRMLADREVGTPFDLENGPLLRCTLLKLHAESHVLFFAMHHIISDGWSIAVLIQEITALYEAFSQNRPSPLPELPLQYADFACWQQQWLKGEILETQLSYWKRQLAGAPPVLELSTDSPRPAVQTFRGDRLEFTVSPEWVEKLQALNQKTNTTMFMTLLSTFALLLSRYSGQEDIVIGSPIANRTRPDLESLIGFFVNTLVLRTNVSGNPRFVDLLDHVKQTCLGAYAHQDMPFEKLVDELQPQRHLNVTPLFQVMLAFENIPSSELTLPGLTFTQQDIQNLTAKFDLLLAIEEDAGTLTGTWEYNSDLFEAATIRRLSEHFLGLLEKIASAPESHIAEYSLLTEAERRQTLLEWNATVTEFPRDECIHVWFERQAAQTPEALAVLLPSAQQPTPENNQSLTYSRLNCQANQLARHLRSLGIGSDSLVGVYVDRSIEMLIGVLAILKAGAAYVPLDTSYPKERLAFMLSDSGLSVLLTQEKLSGGLPEQLNASVIFLDSQHHLFAEGDERNLELNVSPENLAYVIYTSGSTGQPKGVAMRHGALYNLIRWQAEQAKLAADSARTLQFSPISFDVSFQEIFSTWCTGGSLVLLPDCIRRDPVLLLRFLSEQSVQRLFLPFVALQQLAEAAESTQQFPADLQDIITAGEQLRITSSIDNFFENLPNCQLHNHYGPTESHVVTALTLSLDRASWTLFPPIGRPIANARIYLLDRHLQPVPVGIPGELYIGGACLARGYLHRPELTEERFIRNPFDDSPASRLYKTGDAARYLPDGNIEFLGRLDEQVKIRGFRVELGEIEAALAQHPDVREAVVMLREDAPGNPRLAAYILTALSQETLGETLRDALAETLPDYMIPAAFVRLDTFPLTPSGKIDRRSFPAPEGAGGPSRVSIPPESALEECLAGIWTEILGAKTVGRHDNFFELGGHSLLATRVIARIRSWFNVDVPLRSLFEKPTVSGLAATLLEYETSPGHFETTARLRLKIARMSPEDVQKLLKAKKNTP